MENQFSDVIAARIEELGISKSEAARRCGLSHQSLFKVLAGVIPSVNRAHAILSGLGIHARIGAQAGRRRVDWDRSIKPPRGS